MGLQNQLFSCTHEWMIHIVWVVSTLTDLFVYLEGYLFIYLFIYLEGHLHRQGADDDRLTIFDTSGVAGDEYTWHGIGHAMRCLIPLGCQEARDVCMAYDRWCSMYLMCITHSRMPVQHFAVTTT